jgi:hypothetical protein
MWGIALSVVPIGLATGLLAFGQYAGRSPAVSRVRVAAVVVGSVVVGPVALAVLGFWDWLMMLAVLILLLTIYVCARPDLANAWRLVRR